MRKILIIAPILIVISIYACKKAPRKTKFNPRVASCGALNGNTLYKDEQHNCYHLNESGQKQYVENSACSCM